MSMNLMIRNANDNRDSAAAHWAAITSVAKDGYVFIPNDVVNSIAKMLDGVVLSNGEPVSSYAYDDEFYAPFVSAFGPSLLPQDALEKLYDLLAEHQDAVALLTLVIERGLQIGLSGKEHHHEAFIKGVNWPAEEIEINRASGNMRLMLRDMGLEEYFDAEGDCGECPLEAFKKGIPYARHGWEERLQKFVAWAERSKATHIYWG